MYARLQDELLDHDKIATAAERIGDNGGAIALGFYSLAILWCNRQLTDGHIPLATMKTFWQVKDPVAVADALVAARLFDKTPTGYKVHDFSDHNPSARAIKLKREADKLRKREQRDREFQQQNGLYFDS